LIFAVFANAPKTIVKKGLVEAKSVCIFLCSFNHIHLKIVRVVFRYFHLEKRILTIFCYFLFLLEKILAVIICLQDANCGESVAVFPDITNADFEGTKGKDKTVSSEHLKQTN